MMRPAHFIRAIRAATPEPGEAIKLATVDPAYAAGRPKITFDGETTLSTKTYPYLASYTPGANDRVLLVQSGHTWVIIGEIV